MRVTGGAPRCALACAFAGLLSVVGCMAGGDPLEGSTCTEDAECGDGSLCRLGICASTDDLGRVHLEVRPPSSSELITQQVLDVEPRADTRIEVTLRPTIDVAGQVAREDGVPVSARIVAVPEAPIPGRAVVASTTSSIGGAYSLSIVERVRHVMTIYADDAASPPFFATSALVMTVGMNASRDFTLPDPETLVQISGQVVAGGGASALGLPGLHVELRETNGRRVSSVGVTDDDGAFVIALSEGREGPFVLEVTPGEQQPYIPVVRVDLDDTSSDLALDDPIDLGDFGSPVPVDGRVVGPDGNPVAGAAIYLRGAVGAGEVRRQIASDASGNFETDLAPGVYDVAIVAPLSTTPAGMQVLSSSAALTVPREEEIVFTLPSRPTVSGAILDDAGAPLAGALVQFARIGAEGGGAEPALEGATLSTTTTSDLDGRLSVALDPGRYRVRVDPPLGLSVPSTTLVRDVFATPESLEIVLPPARHAAGVVVDDGGAAVAGAQVRVFATLVGEDGAAIALGEGAADEQGLFAVTVPDLTGGP